jgi:hypothetical protein
LKHKNAPDIEPEGQKILDRLDDIIFFEVEINPLSKEEFKQLILKS